MALDYHRAPNDRRVRPSILVGLQFFANQERLALVSTVLDTGADASVIDGAVPLRAGWTMPQIVDRALGTDLIHGIGAGRPITGYRHEITVFIGLPHRFAELRVWALITPPDLLEYSVLGRSNFREQVDVTFAELDKRLYLRFRNQEVVRDQFERS